MYFDFSNVLVFVGVAAFFILAALTFGRIVRPHRPDPEKLSTYECGERPFGGAWFNFNNRFYVIALVFVALEAAVALAIPMAVVLRPGPADPAGAAVPVFLLFFGFIALVLAYVWRHGDIAWVRDIRAAEEEPRD